jgi:hypothetical protein
MTIAACYVCSEGVVFGADSTWTVPVECADDLTVHHYFQYGQKILEVGDGKTIGAVIWGVLLLDDLSFRTLIARFADGLEEQPAARMDEVGVRFRDAVWEAYQGSFQDARRALRELLGKEKLSKEEKEGLEDLKEGLYGGVCLGGYLLPDRTPLAFEVSYDLTTTKPPDLKAVPHGQMKTWGCPSLMNRILYGTDAEVLKAILASGKWNGTKEELIAVVSKVSNLAQPKNLPIREAVDWVDATLETTVKVTKFTHLPPICGGPIDLAVITTDRPFRWVRRKRMSSAVQRHSPEF